MIDARVVLCPCPSREEAESLARKMVEERHAACAQILGAPILAIYRWQGKVEEAAEHMIVFKTSEQAWPRLRDRLAELHPYDVPEILALTATAHEPYLQWLDGECGEGSQTP